MDTQELRTHINNIYLLIQDVGTRIARNEKKLDQIIRFVSEEDQDYENTEDELTANGVQDIDEIEQKADSETVQTIVKQDQKKNVKEIMKLRKDRE